MIDTYTLKLARLEETYGIGRLGRHVEHDERSRAFAVQPTGAQLVSKTWPRRIDILDQGDKGSCTGNAATGLLGTDPFFVPGLPLDEAEALKLYHEATVLDGFTGTYPPDDTGSTGLAVAKACKNDGLISGYQHAFSLDAALTALQDGPVITGVDWYDGFDNPDGNGFVSISGKVRGGHEFVVRGIDVSAQVVLADNSWGSSWGNNGSFSFSFDTWGRLLNAQGDVTVFVPLSAPAPTPTPVPTPGNADAADEAIAPFLRRLLVHPYHRMTPQNKRDVEAWFKDKQLPL